MSNKTYYVLKINQILPIDLKIGTHIDCTYNIYLANNIGKNNVTYAFMATKYPNMKHTAFFLNFAFPQIKKISVRNSNQTFMTTH